MAKRFFSLIALIVLVGGCNQIFAMDPESVGLGYDVAYSVGTGQEEAFSQTPETENASGPIQIEPTIVEMTLVPTPEPENETIVTEQPKEVQQTPETENTSEFIKDELTTVEAKPTTTTEEMTTVLQEESQSQVEQQTGEVLGTLFGVSFDKKMLLYFGVGAVALITIGGVTYVLYKNGTLKKVGVNMQQFIQTHKVGVASTITVAIALSFAGICAKKYGVTFEQAYGWITNLFTKKQSETVLQQIS